MNPAELMAHCEKAGVVLTRGDDGLLLVTAPRGRITAQLRSALKTAKPAILAALRERENLGWRLLYSEALRDIVLLIVEAGATVPDEIRARHVAYTLEEATRLEGADDLLLRAAHAAKRVFGGEVVEGPGGRP